MIFSKYEKLGAYHWRMYDDKNTKYSRHADRVKEWITEKNVLDVGAGDGLITSLLGIKGIDNEPKAVELAQEKGADVILGSIYEIPFHDKSFEAVFLGDTLEHIEFPEKALKECHRVVTDSLYIANPIKGLDNDQFHYQEWTPEELIRLVEPVGFKLLDVFSIVKDKRDYLKFKKI